MGDDDDHTFESAESGASHTYPQQCGELRKGSLVMIKGRPTKVSEISTSKTGKHGHAKAHIVALDIFTGKKYEDLCPTSHNMEVPFSKRTEYQLLSADEATGEVSLLVPDSGDTKDDLNLPTFVLQGEPTDEDKKVTEEILKGQEDGKEVIVAVLSACGMEKIVGCKANDIK
jgi:translation initiation factor 5A